MFFWIEDAMDWMFESFINAWNSMLGSAADAVSEKIWDIMFVWLFNLIYGAISDIFVFINASTSDIFAISWVEAFIELFRYFGWMLYVCGLIVAVFDTAIAYESGQANIKSTCLNVLKGFIAVSLVTVLPQRLYQFCIGLQGTFQRDLIANLIDTTTDTVCDSAMAVLISLSSDVSLFSLFFIILFGYSTIKVVLANIKRGGILLCQIAVGSLYMFGVPRGFSDGFYGWCKQVIATCLTAFLQTTILYLGLVTYTQHALLSVGICLAASEVPRIAQMFGLDTSIHVNMTSISSTINLGSRAIRALGGKK